MKTNLFMLSLFLALQIADSGSFAQNIPSVLKREVNEQVWAVPGIKDLNQVKVYNLREEVIEGIPVQVSSIASDGTRVPGNAKGCSMEAMGIARFAVNRKAFCYRIPMRFFCIDENGSGGALGVSCTYAYYDEQGQGVFTIRDMINDVLGGPDYWHIHLPEWVKKASQKQ